jgi:hypothetical protein
VLHRGDRAAEGELGSDGEILEYKVRMPSARSMRQRTDLAVVSIDRTERNRRVRRSRRVGDRECQSGLEVAILSRWRRGCTSQQCPRDI